MTVLLQVEDLRTEFRTRAGVVRAVDGVSFAVQAGESVGIVGESGSGKTITSLSLLRLIEPPGHVAGGTVRFRGRDVGTMSEAELDALRGGAIGCVFQDPMTALNPVHTVGAQLVEALRAHKTVSRAAATARAVALLELVGIPAPAARLREHPHRLSGGMRQRVMIAMAIANDPSLLILDEPTTALDVTIQAQILDLVRALRTRVNTAVLLITHDIGVVEELCSSVIVMYGGRVMEQGPVAGVTQAPRHPYTAGLLASMPTRATRGQRLAAIAGAPPDPRHMPPGCPFAPRCGQATGICTTDPLLRDLGEGRRVACWHA